VDGCVTTVEGCRGCDAVNALGAGVIGEIERRSGPVGAVA
jgi:hypothetical protein